MSKRINLEPNLSFESISAAKTHFERILNDTAIDMRVTAQEFTTLKALYEEYCRKTNWGRPSPPAAFHPVYERGPGYTTRCFGITFEDGSGRFSLDKALRAIAA
jgi:hypothetical protein